MLTNVLTAVGKLPRQSSKGFRSYAPIAAAYCEVKTMSWEEELEKMGYGKGKEEDKDEEYGGDDDSDDDDFDDSDDDY